MKRGNTALKRGVGLASAFALAIAGAVVAAPAASAAAATVTDVRSTPATDAAYVGTFGVGNLYSVVGTGQAAAVTIGQSWQTTTGIQMLVNGEWGTDNEITLEAPANVVFSANPTATVSKNAVDASDWDQLAGHTGTNAHAFPADGGTVTGSTSVSATGSGGDTITLTLPSDAGTDAAKTYLVSVSGIRVNIDSDYVPTARALDLEVNGTPVTVAYVNSLVLSVKGDSTSVGTDVTLPAVIVSEAVKNAFAAAPADPGDALGAGTSEVLFQIEVSGTANDSTGLTLVSGDAKLASPSSVKNTTTSSGATTFGVSLKADGGSPTTIVNGSTNASALESIGISGLKVENVKPGTDLTLTITAPVAVGDPADPAVLLKGDTSNQSGVASVTVKPTSALPRIAGDNRYETAGDIAAAGSWSGDAVIIANGEDAKQGVDALAANFLAGVLNAPILLTQGDTLPADTESALKDLFDGSSAAVTVYYMGKTDSVSQAVRDKVEATISGVQSVVGSVTSKDVAGDNRYETSVEAAEAVDVNKIASYNLGDGNLRTAFLASGQVNADALAAGAVSAAANIPVLLTTNGAELPKSVSDAIGSLHIEQVLILGGTDRVSQDVEDALGDAGVAVTRIAGSDRYETATKLAQLGIDDPTDGLDTTSSGTIYLANGNGGWADALTAGALVAQTHNSLVTISDSGSLPTSTVLFLTKNKDLLSNVEGLGGTDRVADSAITQAQALIK